MSLPAYHGRHEEGGVLVFQCPAASWLVDTVKDDLLERDTLEKGRC
ncbi:MAG: hypothetical protein MUE57_08875 [Syntrophales bacterium]|nr:hypothetical protein [Syntrophales bacterium]